MSRVTNKSIKHHCVESVRIRSFFESIFSCIRTDYGKVQTRSNSIFGQFSRSKRQSIDVVLVPLLLTLDAFHISLLIVSSF